MPDGTQKIEDTGPLTKKRMETIDDEVTARTLEYLDEVTQTDKPFFIWWNATRMHFRTHVKEENRGISGQGEYNDGMVEHDRHVGMILDKLDELGIADDTIVMYSTDNGPHYNSWPDAAITPFRSEKNSNWEGAYRVPAFLRWPAQVAGRRDAQRHRRPPGHADHVPGRGRRARHRRRSARPATRPAARPSRSCSTART